MATYPTVNVGDIVLILLILPEIRHLLTSLRLFFIFFKTYVKDYLLAHIPYSVGRPNEKGKNFSQTRNF